MSKYYIYKIIEVDGWTEEGRKKLHESIPEGFSASHADYMEAQVHYELHPEELSYDASED